MSILPGDPQRRAPTHSAHLQGNYCHSRCLRGVSTWKWCRHVDTQSVPMFSLLFWCYTYPSEKYEFVSWGYCSYGTMKFMFQSPPTSRLQGSSHWQDCYSRSAGGQTNKVWNKLNILGSSMATKITELWNHSGEKHVWGEQVRPLQEVLCLVGLENITSFPRDWDIFSAGFNSLLPSCEVTLWFHQTSLPGKSPN